MNRFVRLETTAPGTRCVYVNPDMVTRIAAYDDGIHVYLAEGGGRYGSNHVVVMGTISSVARALDGETVVQEGDWQASKREPYTPPSISTVELDPPKWNPLKSFVGGIG